MQKSSSFSKLKKNTPLEPQKIVVTGRFQNMT